MINAPNIDVIIQKYNGSYEVIERVRGLVEWAHAGQAYIGGVGGTISQYTHCVAVAERVAALSNSTQYDVMVALMHDLLSGSSITSEVVAYEFGDTVASDVTAVTKLPLETIDEHSLRLLRSNNTRAIAVKMCELDEELFCFGAWNPRYAGGNYYMYRNKELYIKNADLLRKKYSKLINED